MGIDFSVAKYQYPDNSSTITTDIDTDLDALGITTVYSISVTHLHGFYVLIVIYA